MADEKSRLPEEFKRALDHIEAERRWRESNSTRSSSFMGSELAKAMTRNTPPPKEVLSKRRRDALRARTGPIFIVHGHDEPFRHEVENLVHKLKLEPVVLKDLRSQGRTIIEKLEALDDPAFVLVLATPDDQAVDPKKTKENLTIDTANAKEGQTSVDLPQGTFRLRARQNVILELGYFMARVKRANVLTLMKYDIEWPSDLSGVVYVRPDSHWKVEVADEMRGAGVPIDPELIAKLR